VRGRRALIVVALLVSSLAAAGDALDALGSEDTRAVDAAVTAIEHGPVDADALFAAAHACEDRLDDPARAAKLYERIVHELPDARVAIAAARRAEILRAQLGPHDEYARQTAQLTNAIAVAERHSADSIGIADRLAHESWPGAADAELWAANWLRGHGRHDDALARYAELARRFPGSPQALLGAREAAGCALDARRWDLAERLARELPGGNPVEDAARDELIAAAKRGRHRDVLTTGAVLALVLAALVLLASLADSALRGGRRWPSLRPPIEVMFFAPIAVLLVAVAWLGQRTIAPAVTRISITGIALGWLSGAALDLLRARGRRVRARSLVHVAACVLGVVAIAYISIVRDDLIDLIRATGQGDP
jgi:hypothetical protein